MSRSIPMVLLALAACKQPPVAEQPPKETPMSTTLTQAAKLTVEDYDPMRVVQAVNALQPLGKEAALEQIASYVRRHPDPAESQGLFWVLRVLFDVPAGQAFPPVRLGQPSVPPPADPATMPRFPILLVQDIPFLVVTGYDLAGMPEPVDAHVAHFRSHGVLRSKPLSPSSTGVADELARQWRAAYGDAHAAEGQRAWQAQLARMAP
jgi:hypothetical protein